MVIKNKICVCREQMDLKKVGTFVDIKIAVQFIIFITCETRVETCPKTEKKLVSASSMGGKKR